MKKMIVSLAICSLGICSMSAQTTREEAKKIIESREKLVKKGKKAVEVKVLEDAKKEAKRLAKEGWKPGPGTLPVERQLDNQFRKRYEVTENQTPKYIIGSGVSNPEASYTRAKTAATEFARISVANQLESEVSNVIESSVANIEKNGSDAKSLLEVVSTSVTKVKQSLGKLPIVTEVCREVGGKKEVTIVLCYESYRAKESILEAISQENEEAYTMLKELLSGWE